jgi:general secretion pathway protein G
MKKRIKALVRRLSRSEKGFTLIELLVVVGILAVLAAVVTLGVTQFIGRGNEEAWNTERHNVQTAIAAYMVDNSGGIPSGLSDLDTYLLTSCKWTDWAWDSNGKVSNTNPY